MSDPLTPKHIHDFDSKPVRDPDIADADITPIGEAADTTDKTMFSITWTRIKAWVLRDVLSLLLPVFPARGSRDGKIAKFEGDALGWEDDPVENVRQLPEFPAMGSRNNKVPKFDGDALGWEEDAEGDSTSGAPAGSARGPLMATSSLFGDGSTALADGSNIAGLTWNLETNTVFAPSFNNSWLNYKDTIPISPAMNGMWVVLDVAGVEQAAIFMPWLYGQSGNAFETARIDFGTSVGASPPHLDLLNRLRVGDPGIEIHGTGEAVPAQSRIRIYQAIVRGAKGDRGLPGEDGNDGVDGTNTDQTARNAASAAQTAADAAMAAIPDAASNADVDAESDDDDYVTVLKVFRAIARKVRNASTTVRGIVLLARNEDVDATETDTSRVPDVSKVTRLITRLLPTAATLGRIPASSPGNRKFWGTSSAGATSWRDRVTVEALTSAATIAWDVDEGEVADLTLAHNTTLNLSGGDNGWSALLRVTQDTTGSRTLALHSSIQTGGRDAPTLSTAANSTDWLLFNRIGTVWHYLGIITA